LSSPRPYPRRHGWAQNAGTLLHGAAIDLLLLSQPCPTLRELLCAPRMTTTLAPSSTIESSSPFSFFFFSPFFFFFHPFFFSFFLFFFVFFYSFSSFFFFCFLVFFRYFPSFPFLPMAPSRLYRARSTTSKPPPALQLPRSSRPRVSNRRRSGHFARENVAFERPCRQARAASPRSPRPRPFRQHLGRTVR